MYIVYTHVYTTHKQTLIYSHIKRHLACLNLSSGPHYGVPDLAPRAGHLLHADQPVHPQDVIREAHRLLVLVSHRGRLAGDRGVGVYRKDSLE